MVIFPLTVLLATCSIGDAFQPLLPSTPRTTLGLTVTRTTTALGVISADEVDFKFDTGLGGVRLAQESAVKLTGTVKHKPGSATPKVKDLIRYTGLTPVDNSDVLSSDSIKIITTGIGKEDYRDPGETTEMVVKLAPLDAVRDSLNAAGSAMEYPRLVINLAGGDDLQVLEVTEAVRLMVLDLDIKTKCDISFNSLSHSSLPRGIATITVVGLVGEESNAGGLEGAAKSVANGEVYFYDEKYWTVSDKDINDAVA